MASVIVNDDLFERLKEYEITSDEGADLLRHVANERIVVCVLALLEGKGLVFDVAKSHKGEQVAEELAALWHVKVFIILLSADKWGRMDCMILVESHFQNVSSQMIYLVANIFILVVHKQADDIVGRVRLVRSEVAGLIYEHA